MKKAKWDYDVIVVGAGYAGLIAARNLIEAGLKVIVLEAANRVGGRAFSTPFPGTNHIVDWGAEWILPEMHSGIMAELQRYNIPLDQTTDDSTPRWIIGQQEIAGYFSELLDERPSFNNLLSDLDNQAKAYAEKRQDPSTSLSQAIAHSAPSALDAALMKAAFFPLTGADPDLVSAATMWKEVYYHGGTIIDIFEPEDVCRIAGGTAAIIHKIATELHDVIQLETFVSKIDNGPDHTTVSGAFGALTASKCILALPLRTLSAITFLPPLTAHQTLLAEEGNVGRTMKLWALVTGETHPSECHLTGHTLRYTYAKQVAENQYLICAQVLSDEVKDRSNDALKALFHRIYPTHEILNVEFKDWPADPFARASWQISRTGQTEAVSTHFTTNRDLTFCGSDYMDPWMGWIEGAILSGREAAKNVANALITQ